MKPSKCKICGVAEWDHSCAGVVEKKPQAVNNHSGIASLQGRLTAIEIKLTAQIAMLKRLEEIIEELVKGPSEARRKYMRDYMKKRRSR